MVWTVRRAEGRYMLGDCQDPYQWTVDELVAANKEVDCDKLQIGRELCVRAHSD
jgi:hypothetical protein